MVTGLPVTSLTHASCFLTLASPEVAHLSCFHDSHNPQRKGTTCYFGPQTPAGSHFQSAASQWVCIIAGATLWAPVPLCVPTPLPSCPAAPVRGMPVSLLGLSRAEWCRAPALPRHESANSPLGLGNPCCLPPPQWFRSASLKSSFSESCGFHEAFSVAATGCRISCCRCSDTL